jgi:hypothetical protein
MSTLVIKFTYLAVIRYLVLLFTILILNAFGPRDQGRNCESVIDASSHRQIFNKVDKEAKIVVGIDKLYSELSTIRLPKNPKTDQINLSISIIVEANGGVSNLMTLQTDRDAKLETELLRIFKKYKWEPALCNETKVATRVILKVVS